jgi:hypothetical protein
MKNIIIKEVDRLYSQIHKINRLEYLIYLMEGDVKVSCINVIGEDAKKCIATLSYTWLVNKNNVKG